MAEKNMPVSTIPSRDPVFRRVVERAIAVLTRHSPQDLANRLRPLYPRVAVFERQLSGEDPQFYVYRDGRYEPDQPDEGWDEPGVARVQVSLTTGRLTYVSGEWAALMGGDSGELAGRHYTDFIAREAREAAAAMFEAVRDERVVGSEARVMRADGTTILIEFRATKKDGEIEVRYRPLDR